MGRARRWGRPGWAGDCRSAAARPGWGSRPAVRPGPREPGWTARTAPTSGSAHRGWPAAPPLRGGPSATGPQRGAGWTGSLSSGSPRGSGHRAAIPAGPAVAFPSSRTVGAAARDWRHPKVAREWNLAMTRVPAPAVGEGGPADRAALRRNLYRPAPRTSAWSRWPTSARSSTAPAGRPPRAARSAGHWPGNPGVDPAGPG